MSLTKLIEKKEVKHLMQEYFTFPGTKPPERQIIAPPQTKNYTEQGQAFDYLFRFHLADKCNKPDGHWVAESALPLIRANEKRYIYQKAVSLIRNAKHALADKNRASWPLHAIRLARLEQVARNGRQLRLTQMKRPDINDLEHLIKIVPWQEIYPDLSKRSAQQHVHLNPGFGNASLLVGGADADFIVGDTLVDIKTTMYLKFGKGMWYQLLGYATLNRIAGNPYQLKNMAIYFSRHGVYFKMKMPTLPRAYVSEFKALATDYIAHTWPYMAYSNLDLDSVLDDNEVLFTEHEAYH